MKTSYYKYKGTKEEAGEYEPVSPQRGINYSENYLFNEKTVLYLSKHYPDEWEKAWEEEEPTLESLTDQIKKLAKKQGMDCNVVLEKKKEVEVWDFLAIHYPKQEFISLSVKIKNPISSDIGAKAEKIEQAIKNILEND